MNCVCIICSDGVSQHAEVFSTHCGHVFHYTCLIQWLERSKTCPQCRNKASEKTIHRIFLNFSNVDPKTDVASLQSSLENVQFQLMLKEKDVKNYTEKYHKLKNQNSLLRGEIVELENSSRSHDSVVHALKDQILFFKSKAKERDKYVEELGRLKARIKQMEAVDLAVNGSREEVTEMLKSGNDMESLVILVATLKKALLDAEKKKMNVEHKFKQVQNELTNNRRDIMQLEMANKDLRKELEAVRMFKKKEPVSLARIKNRPKSNDSRILKDDGDGDLSFILDSSTASCTNVAEDDAKPKEHSDSPYLKLKKGSSVIDLPSQRKTATEINPRQMSIFKKVKLTEPKTTRFSADGVMYNGLGGQSKEDLYPTPKCPKAGIKRHIESYGSNPKFRKTGLHAVPKK